MSKIKNYWLLITAGVLIILSSELIFIGNSNSLKDIAKNVSEQLLRKQKATQQILNKTIIDRGWKNYEFYKDLYESENTGIYLFDKDSLVFWNNSQIELTKEIVSQTEQGLLKLKQGYFLIFIEKKENITALGLCLLKPTYNLQNNYLQNNFSEWLGIPKNIELADKNTNKNTVILNDKSLFTLTGEDVNYSSKSFANACSLIYFLGIGILFLGLLAYYNSAKNTMAIAIVLITPIILKLLFWLKLPSFLVNTILFDVQLFGNAQSILNPFLADILFNSIVLVYISVVIFLTFIKESNKRIKLIFQSFIYVFIVLIASQINHTLKSLVTNSTLSFDFLSVFNIKIPALIGLLALVFNSIALFICVYKSILFFSKNVILDGLKFTAIILFGCLFMQFVLKPDIVYLSYWLLLFSLVLFILVKINVARATLGLGFQVLIISAITAGFLNFYISKNKNLDLEFLAYKLSERQDPNLQSEFATIPKKIQNDEKLKVLLEFLPSSQKEIEQLLKQKYFIGYFNRYNIDYSMFDKDCKPLLNPSKPILINEGFFEDQIRELSDSTSIPELFFVEKHKENSRYIAKIKLVNYNLYLLMEPKQFEELGSFPDLFLDQSQQKQEKLKNFSYAVYRSDQNTSRYGEYNYPFFISDSTSLTKSNPNYVHHYFNPDDATEIIISEKVKGWNYFFTYNSYLFLFFSVISYLCYFIYALVFTNRFATASLTRRIQSIVILLLLLAMSAVGLTSGRLVTDQFENDNKKVLQEKTLTIINELETQFKTQELFSTTQKELVNLKLKEYAHLFNTDISLFNKNGQLFNTSQARLYDFGLASTLANPQAFNELSSNQSSGVCVNEKAGNLSYLSFYTPLFDGKKELIGFINLPYFAKQNDLVNELSGIISALINVYIILFVISILSGLILASYITQPLRLIKQQIANITLGKQNEKIVWQSNDEIGKLVNEYNQMLIKLEESANLLAQSERESAWREMAKQVAHEIKNPLTPMKLNLQYLQHVMKNNPEDFNQKFENASKSIIEQIDTLANIATEFSNFAKLPSTQLQTINLVEIINSSVLIFENYKNIEIQNSISEADVSVKGDKDQALRVFNNILKNAVQALSETKNPKIIIEATEKENKIIIAITDNGCGIAEELIPKLFTPNFTTKSTGSGLGLAMVKSSMQSFGGNVWFKSQVNEGTTFYLEFMRT
ncbi:MAG: HAMP domain-containing sensor histidine kinase [Bacteroidota bacterium]|nr:HAMP domain-containing sensor histidine kinase [Bacteroidota bacterium]